MNYRYHNSKRFAFSVLLMMLYSGCANEPTNHAPTVSSIAASPSQVQLSDSFLVICSAHDVDGDPLTYDWECSNHGASIKGAPSANPFKLTNTTENMRVFYSADSIPGGYATWHAAIFCDVRDGRGGLKTVTITLPILRR